MESGGHPHILRLYYTCTKGASVWCVTDYCPGGELLDHIRTRTTRLHETQVAHVMHQIGSALQFLHKKRIVHLDVSLENILVTNNGHLQLCDFGAARYLKLQSGAVPDTITTTTSTSSSSSSSSTNSALIESKNTAEPSATETTELLIGKVGKHGYMAPEVYEGLPFDGRLADMFSIGVVLFLLLVGCPPWKLPTTTGTFFFPFFFFFF